MRFIDVCYVVEYIIDLVLVYNLRKIVFVFIIVIFIHDPEEPLPSPASLVLYKDDCPTGLEYIDSNPHSLS